MDSGLASASLRRPGMTRLNKVDALAPSVLTQDEEQRQSLVARMDRSVIRVGSAAGEAGPGLRRAPSGYGQVSNQCALELKAISDIARTLRSAIMLAVVA